ncbi:uncharacterized protein LOC132499258 [Mesoplodon densirostris]|uniref:uncharacterized protein LOC132499258 n=1 Tax=Mesoplodon densirostris TaxID=48708 RepID=UPI0028DC2E06|nr:uncharacterized protein LOC132499258 [Mesoplodon densirostris]
MAGAAAATLVPVLHSVAGDKSGYHVGQQLRFGFIAVYEVVVHVVPMPRALIHEDVWCHGNITCRCLAECFENRFSSLTVGLGRFSFFCFLMEFFMAQVRHKQIKARSVESVAGDVEEGSVVGIREQVPSPKTAAPNFYWEEMLLCPCCTSCCRWARSACSCSCSGTSTRPWSARPPSTAALTAAPGPSSASSAAPQRSACPSTRSSLCPS